VAGKAFHLGISAIAARRIVIPRTTKSTFQLLFGYPAGSFEAEGEPDKQKFRFHSAKGSQPDIKARLDFLKCKFELKVKGVIDTSEITAETLAIVLQAGAFY